MPVDRIIAEVKGEGSLRWPSRYLKAEAHGAHLDNVAEHAEVRAPFHHLHDGVDGRPQHPVHLVQHGATGLVVAVLHARALHRGAGDGAVQERNLKENFSNNSTCCCCKHTLAPPELWDSPSRTS